MLDNREVGRTLRANDDVLAVLKGQVIKGVQYTERADGRSETVRILLDNGFALDIESDALSGECSHLIVCIEKEDQ